MLVLNNDAKLVCAHALGKVGNRPSQNWVRIQEREVLVAPDPIGCSIAGCPNIGVGIKPCATTLTQTAGKSVFISIDNRPICLDTTTGLTDGTPPGTVLYSVIFPGQQFVRASL